jgi:hypothetical protein
VHRARQVYVIDQDTDPYPPVSRLDNALSQDPAGGIRLPDIVLNIQAPLGQLGKRNTGCEGLASVANDGKPGLVRMLLRHLFEELTDARLQVLLICRRGGARIVFG